jgi:GNAT superfamily N-acetyltransferase
LAELPTIERSAAQRFQGLDGLGVDLDDIIPVSFHAPLQAAGTLWVAETDGGLIGFAACEAFDDALHLWELDVRRDVQGRGVGRALLAAVAKGGRERGLPAVSLTTFHGVAWNRPFYERQGFRTLAEDQINDRLRTVLAREAGNGLKDRCAMRLSL